MSEDPAPLQTQFEKDVEWKKNVFKGDVRQLTPRAVITGLLLGWFMAASNLYVGLKSGWIIGVEITACVLGFAIWRGVTMAKLTKRPFGMLENNILMTSAVAPSYIAGAGLVAPIPAIWMLNPDFPLTFGRLAIWIVSILFLGLMVVIPVKRQMINSGELKFPAAVPAAETLKSMYAAGTQAIRKAIALAVAGVIGITNQVFMHVGFIPTAIPVWFTRIRGITVSKLTLVFEPSWLFVGIGAFIGPRVGLTMLFGALLNYAVLGPWMIHEKEIHHDPPDITSEKFLEFPLSIPANSILTFELKEALEGPEMEDGSSTIRTVRVWKDSTTYPSIEALITDMNTESGSNTLPRVLEFYREEVSVPVDEESYHPVPFLKLGFAPFKLTRPVMEKRDRLHVKAPENIYWESSLQVVESDLRDAGPLLGFAPGTISRPPLGGFGNIVSWTMWPGVAMLVFAGILPLFFQWKVFARAFGGFLGSLKRKTAVSAKDEDPLKDIEVPMSWFVIGYPIFSILAIILMYTLYQIPVWMGILAVILSFFLAVVAIRAMGETGIGPIGAMGKVTQLTFGVLNPGNIQTNLMTANVTAGGATSAGDMTNMLKVGHIVGAKPRAQFVSQFIGIIVALTVIPVFFILVPDPGVLGTNEVPAPAAIVWAGIAKLLSQGIETLPPTAVKFLIYGALFGTAIAFLERFHPRSKGWVWLPSPAALGIAMTVPAQYSFSMFLGAMIALLVPKINQAAHDLYTIPVASGFIAGESLTGVAFAVMAALGAG